MSTYGPGPVTHRRQPGWPRRTAGVMGAALLIVATLAAGLEIVVRTPDQEVVAGYFLQRGGVGDRVAALDFAATVVSVRGGTAVVTERGEELHTDGVWILVRMRVEAFTEPQWLQFGAIQDRRGRTFDYTERFKHPLDGYKFQPGVPVEGEMVFEVPRDAVPQAHMRLYNALVADSRHQSIVDIDLGLDEATLESWLADADPLRLTEPEVNP